MQLSIALSSLSIVAHLAPEERAGAFGARNFSLHFFHFACLFCPLFCLFFFKILQIFCKMSIDAGFVVSWPE
jgi:hypothetical protein